jgi:hypothetical protein
MSFKNVFDSGGGEADSAKKAAQALNSDTPGAGNVSEAVRNLESQRAPWLVRQTAHGAFDVIGFLDPLFQKFHDVSGDISAKNSGKAWKRRTTGPVVSA